METAIKVTRLAARRLTDGDEAHRVEFSDGTTAYFYFNGSPVYLKSPDGTVDEAAEWETSYENLGRSDALQAEYARINQAGTDYLEMTDTEFEDWRATTKGMWD